MTEFPLLNRIKSRLGGKSLATLKGTLMPVASAKGAFGLLSEMLGKFVREVEAEVGPGKGGEKKELVLALLLDLYDQHIAPLDIPWVPNTLVEPWVDAKIRELIPLAFDSLIDQMVSFWNAEPIVVEPETVVLPVTKGKKK